MSLRIKRRKCERRRKLRALVVKWAVAFIECEDAQGSLSELKGTQSASAPAEFMNLAEAVHMYKENSK